MFTQNQLKQVISSIVEDPIDWAKDTVEQVEEFFETNLWPLNLNREKTLKAIDCLITGEMPELDPATVMIDMMLLQSRKMPKISKARKGLLKRIKKVFEDAKVNDCKHENTRIGVFMHGGGFSPTFGAPELICLDCSLNITLYPGIKPKEYGLKISKKSLAELNDWAKKEFKNQDYQSGRVVLSANKIVENPVAAYNKTIQWQEKVPVEFLDFETVTKRTGT